MMSVSLRSTGDLLSALREHPEWRDEVRRAILTDDLLALPARFERAELERKEESRRTWEAIRETNAALKVFTESTEKRFLEVDQRLESLESILKAFMESTEKRFFEVDQRLESLESTLTAFMESTEKRFLEVDKRLESLESTLTAFMESTEKRFRWIEIELDYFAGKSMEVDARKKLGNYMRQWVGKLRDLDSNTVNAMIDTAADVGELSQEEANELGEADILAVGKSRETGKPACVVVEVSKTVDRHDVARADRRARLFLKAGRAAVAAERTECGGIFPAMPESTYGLVVGRRITEGAAREARRMGVRFAEYKNGPDREAAK